MVHPRCMSEESYVQFKLRLPESVRDRLERACEESGRSMSAEIIFRLEAALPKTEADLRLRDLRRALWEIDVRMSVKKSQLADINRLMGAVPLGHKDRQFYAQKLADTQAGLDQATEERAQVLAELSSYAKPSMDHD